MNRFLKSLALLGCIALGAQTAYAAQQQDSSAEGEIAKKILKQQLKQDLIGMATQHAVQQYPALAPYAKAYQSLQTAQAVVGGCYEPQVTKLTPEQEASAYRQAEEAQAAIAVRRRLPSIPQPTVRKKTTPSSMAKAHQLRAANRGVRISSTQFSGRRTRAQIQDAATNKRKRQEQARLARQAQAQQAVATTDEQQQERQGVADQQPSQQSSAEVSRTHQEQESPKPVQSVEQGQDEAGAEASAAPLVPKIPGIPEDARIVKSRADQRLYAVRPPQFNLGAAPRVYANLLAMRKVQGAVSSGLARVLPGWLAYLASPFAGVAAYVALNAAYENFIEPVPLVQKARQGLARVEGVVSEAARPAVNRIASWWNWMRGKPAVPQAETFRPAKQPAPTGHTGSSTTAA